MIPDCIGSKEYNGIRNCTCGATGCPFTCLPKDGDSRAFTITYAPPKPDFQPDLDEPVFGPAVD